MSSASVCKQNWSLIGRKNIIQGDTWIEGTDFTWLEQSLVAPTDLHLTYHSLGVDAWWLCITSGSLSAWLMWTENMWFSGPPPPLPILYKVKKKTKEEEDKGWHPWIPGTRMPDLPELDKWLGNFTTTLGLPLIMTYSSWLNCALRGDEAVYWVSMG